MLSIRRRVRQYKLFTSIQIDVYVFSWVCILFIVNWIINQCKMTCDFPKEFTKSSFAEISMNRRIRQWFNITIYWSISTFSLFLWAKSQNSNRKVQLQIDWKSLACRKCEIAIQSTLFDDGRTRVMALLSSIVFEKWKTR